MYLLFYMYNMVRFVRGGEAGRKERTVLYGVPTELV